MARMQKDKSAPVYDGEDLNLIAQTENTIHEESGNSASAIHVELDLTNIGYRLYQVRNVEGGYDTRIKILIPSTERHGIHEMARKLAEYIMEDLGGRNDVNRAAEAILDTCLDEEVMTWLKTRVK